MDDPHASTLSQPNSVQGLRTSVRSRVQASTWRPPYVAGAAYTASTIVALALGAAVGVATPSRAHVGELRPRRARAGRSRGVR